jgi:hypothetical protein
MSLGTFKEWPFTCFICDKHFRALAWSSDFSGVGCPDCTGESFYDPDPLPNKAPGIVGDDIPGGLEIKHGLCNPDGTPRKFYSKTEIKRAANEAGVTWADDTPKPYNVPWSGKRRVDEPVKPIVKEPSA